MSFSQLKNVWTRLKNVQLNGDIMRYTGSGEDDGVGFAQTATPLSPRSHFYQVEILEPGENSSITIGLARRGYSEEQPPGLDTDSVAYDIGVGEILTKNCEGRNRVPVCAKGDRIGCGIAFSINMETTLLPTSRYEPPRVPTRSQPGLMRRTLEHYVYPRSNEDDEILVKVFFTKNGQTVSSKTVRMPPGGLYPTLGLLSPGAIVRLDMKPRLN